VAIPLPSEQEQGQEVVSPFAQTTATVTPAGKGRSSAWILWVLGIFVAIAGIGTAGYFIQQYLNDPYRTLEPFPVDKYMSDYQSLVGSKFKADVKVTAELPSKPEVGRLMVFTCDSDSRPIPVLVPPKLSNIYFNKGQNFRASLEVQDGGLIYADSCEKN
jgi:hypothetical protein